MSEVLAWKKREAHAFLAIYQTDSTRPVLQDWTPVTPHPVTPTFPDIPHTLPTFPMLNTTFELPASYTYCLPCLLRALGRILRDGMPP
jgi:phage tail protein X